MDEATINMILYNINITINIIVIHPGLQPSDIVRTVHALVRRERRFIFDQEAFVGRND